MTSSSALRLCQGPPLSLLATMTGTGEVGMIILRCSEGQALWSEKVYPGIRYSPAMGPHGERDRAYHHWDGLSVLLELEPERGLLSHEF